MITMTTTPITAALTALLHELAEEIPDVLTESFTFAGVWADLCRLAGEPLPADVAAALDAPIHATPRLTVRGSYADHRLEFPEATAGWEPA